ncbi:MAG: DUF5668 domain-containing protein [Dictyoglomus thermophilum]|uniref:LiaI-LiaF-like domain-containing protein n=1 Tax=Dictyoglomus thermophilum TaxID=14 RepID=UPI00165430D6|nr:DUF5668 domain-containing protein [Dictyoglomus thermophilum]
MFNKVFWSILLIIIGLSLLANNFDVPVLKDLWKLWPLVFIYIGIKLIFPKYRRNIKMREERYKILKLVEEGRIRADEAEELIKKLEEVSKKEKRYLRVNVVEKERDIVNITVPLSFLSWGLKFANTYAGKYGEKIEISPEEIENLINDPDFKGRIVDINDPDDDVQVVIEIL